MTGLPAGWRLLTPDQLGGHRQNLTIGPFGSHLKVSDYRDSGVPLVFTRHIRSGDFAPTSTRFISQEKADLLYAHTVRPGDVLITKMGDPPGDACVYKGSVPAVITADCIRLRPSEGYSSAYIALAVQSPDVRRQMELITRGVAQRKVSLARFRDGIRLPVPSLDEQRRIVDILEDHLSRLDAADSLLTLARLRLRVLHKSVLMDLVPDASAYPAHWTQSTVSEAGNVGLGRQRHPDWHTGANMHPYLRVANVFEDRIDLSDVKGMHWPDNSFERFRLKPGDVLLNEGQSPEFLGRPAMYRGEPPDIAFTNTLIRFQANDHVLPEFALLVFRRHMHAGRFARESRITTNIAHLSASRLKPIEFPIPPLGEQKRLVGLAEQQLGDAARLGDQVCLVKLRIKALRRSLLAAAFSGRLNRRSSDLVVADELSAASS